MPSRYNLRITGTGKKALFLYKKDGMNMIRQAYLDALEPRLLNLFEYLHENPEPSWEEWETTKYLAQLLADEGYEPQLFED